MAISSLTMALAHAPNTSNGIRTIPTPADFRVPVNMIEHNLIIERLVSGGSLQAEAEQTIAGRKTAFIDYIY